MYEISNEVRGSIINQIIKVLDDRNYPYTDRAIENIVDTFIDAKASLIDMLSNHPNWNPEKLMVQFDEDYSREFNSDALYGFGNWLYRAIIREKRCTSTIDNIVIDFIKFGIKDQFFSAAMKNDIDRINALNESFKLRTNMKSSKAILKLCKEMGYDKLPHTGELPNSTKTRKRYDDFNYEYAKLCDNINPIKTTRHTCISLNPVDFLLMSNGSSWESCHYIGFYDDDCDDPGCYSSGTVSYMLDECSFIFYTVDAEFDGADIELEPKIQRQVFGYRDEAFIQSRLYPQSMDCGAEAIYTDIRNVVQKVIADCLEKPNLWIKSTENVNDIVGKGSGATCYADWYFGNPGASLCSVSKIKGTTKFPKIILGAKPICVECGCTHNVENNINCCHKEYHCENCGCYIDEDDVRWIGDYTYCYDCIIYCEDCDGYELADEAVTVYYRNRWGTQSKYVCRDCAERYYYKCDHCGDYWHEDDIVETEEGNWYCPECDDQYMYCEKCEAYHDSDCFQYDEVDDMYYCNDCYEEIIEEREEEQEEIEDAV